MSDCCTFCRVFGRFCFIYMQFIDSKVILSIYCIGNIIIIIIIIIIMVFCLITVVHGNIFSLGLLYILTNTLVF